MSEIGSHVCPLSTVYEGNLTELARLATAQYPTEYLSLLAQFAANQGKFLSENAASELPLCALKMRNVHNLETDLAATLCEKQSDTTFRACSIPRNLAEWKKHVSGK